jgi:mRNA-degrading endonuclease RelE of RelBE toxin-antitoxin system
MAWLVILSSRAERNIKRIPAADRLRILFAVEQMRVDPLSGDVVKLRAQEAFRRRVGSYRIIFSIDFRGHIVGISDVQRRTSTTY